MAETIKQGDTVEVTAKGSPLFGQFAAVAEGPDAEGCYVLTMAKVWVVEAVPVDGSPLQFRVPASHFVVHPATTPSKLGAQPDPATAEAVAEAEEAEGIAPRDGAAAEDGSEDDATETDGETDEPADEPGTTESEQ